MASVNIYNQIVTNLATSMSMTAWLDVYTAPLASVANAMKPFEIQVIDNGSQYGDRSGSIRSEDFQLEVALFVRLTGDFAGHHYLALKDLATGIHVKSAAVISALDLNRVNNGSIDLLTRPLALRSESAVRTTNVVDLLVKSLYFTGGVNYDLI